MAGGTSKHFTAQHAGCGSARESPDSVTKLAGNCFRALGRCATWVLKQNFIKMAPDHVPPCVASQTGHQASSGVRPGSSPRVPAWHLTSCFPFILQILMSFLLDSQVLFCGQKCKDMVTSMKLQPTIAYAHTFHVTCTSTVRHL